MSDLDKLSIYVPESMARSLDRDAKLFEILKRDGRHINRNRFLGLVLLGHHDTFVAERRRLAEIVGSELANTIGDDALRNEIAKNVARKISAPTPPNRRLRGCTRLSFKPTQATEGIVREAFAELGPDDTASRYFYGLLESYCSKASYERELIVHKERADLLRRACRSRETVSFVLALNRLETHRVVPYKLVEGQDGLLNYLLCYEEDNPERRALAHRLSRIERPRLTGDKGTIPSDVEHNLTMMERLGPQFAINDNIETCVRMTEKGLDTYQRIYLGRPEFAKVEVTEGGFLCRFNCSLDQLFLYFKRFGADEAEVVSPQSLRERLIAFHIGALEMYGEQGNPL